MDERFINSSTWMRDTLHLIGHKSLTDLVLPGTHDSAAYKFSDKYMPGAQSKKVQRIINITDFLIKNIIKSVEITQELTVYKQLKRGARYLDIRAGWLDHKWYTYHCHAGPTVEKVLKDVKRFLKKYECEVVIIEISHFRNKTTESEGVLKALILNYLGDMLCDVNPTLKFPLFDIISRNKRAIVCMPKLHDSKMCIWSDSILKNSYPNKSKVKKIKEYNENRIKDNPPNKLLKISWILTPDASNLKEKLLKLAKGVNSEMLKSFYNLSAKIKLKRKLENVGVVDEQEKNVFEEKEIKVEEEEEKKEELEEDEKNEGLAGLSDESEQEDEEEGEGEEESKIDENKGEILGHASLKGVNLAGKEKTGLEGIIILIDHFGKSNIMHVIYDLNNLIHS